MKKILTIILLFVSVDLPAGTYLKILYIADHPISCGPSKTCLLSRNSPSDEWSIFNGTIEGFNYESGYEYCLLTEVRESSSDTNTIKYVLSELKSKKRSDMPGSLSPKTCLPDSSKWILYKLKTSDGIRTFSISKGFIQFGLQNEMVSGNTGCNSFQANFTADSSQFVFKDLIFSKTACGKHAIEPDFLKALYTTTHYKVTSSLLYLYRGKYLLALFTRKK